MIKTSVAVLPHFSDFLSQSALRNYIGIFTSVNRKLFIELRIFNILMYWYSSAFKPD